MITFIANIGFINSTTLAGLCKIYFFSTLLYENSYKVSKLRCYASIYFICATLPIFWHFPPNCVNVQQIALGWRCKVLEEDRSLCLWTIYQITFNEREILSSTMCVGLTGTTSLDLIVSLMAKFCPFSLPWTQILFSGKGCNNKHNL